MFALRWTGRAAPKWPAGTMECASASGPYFLHSLQKARQLQIERQALQTVVSQDCLLRWLNGRYIQGAAVLSQEVMAN